MATSYCTHVRPHARAQVASGARSSLARDLQGTPGGTSASTLVARPSRAPVAGLALLRFTAASGAANHADPRPKWVDWHFLPRRGARLRWHLPRAASLRLLLRLSTDSCGEGGENSDIIRGAAAAVAVKSMHFHRRPYFDVCHSLIRELIRATLPPAPRGGKQAVRQTSAMSIYAAAPESAAPAFPMQPVDSAGGTQDAPVTTAAGGGGLVRQQSRVPAELQESLSQLTRTFTDTRKDNPADCCKKGEKGCCRHLCNIFCFPCSYYPRASACCGFASLMLMSILISGAIAARFNLDLQLRVMAEQFKQEHPDGLSGGGIRVSAGYTEDEREEYPAIVVKSTDKGFEVQDLEQNDGLEIIEDKLRFVHVVDAATAFVDCSWLA